MSVIIKGMQMPEECEVCPMHHFHADTGKTVCILTNATLAKDYELGIPFNRHESCPLIELKEERMTRLEKVSFMKTGLSEMELINSCCPHDFGIKDEAKRYKNGWGCKAPSGCKKCWNKEVDDE